MPPMMRIDIPKMVCVALSAAFKVLSINRYYSVNGILSIFHSNKILLFTVHKMNEFYTCRDLKLFKYAVHMTLNRMLGYEELLRNLRIGHS